MYKLRIATGIKAPAWIMLPLSESDVDKAVFNGIVRCLLNKDHVDTQEEFDKVCRHKHEVEEKILHVLEDAQDIHDPPTEEECVGIENFIAARCSAILGHPYKNHQVKPGPKGL